jgi:glycosyltransferase involved in cell wall biosynthesis
VFRPVARHVARELLQLPADRKFVLFSAMGGAANKIKGFDLLAQALTILSNTHRAERVELLVAGASSVPSAAAIGVPVRAVGAVADDLSLALLYSAADLFVAPSRQENLANTVMEAMSCGTPFVAFDVGGMSDLAGDTAGILVKPFDVAALAQAIASVLGDREVRERRGAAARVKAVAEYSLTALARRYLELYATIAQV